MDTAEIGKRRRANVGLTADLKQLLPQLATRRHIAPWRAHCAELKKAHAWRYDHPGEAIYAPLMLRQLSDLLPGSAVVACDVGQHQMWVAQHMRFYHPENHLSSAGLGTMGFGLPAAIGARIARPDDPVVLVTGDGSFMMSLQELGTLKRAGTPIKILLLNNRRRGMVRQWQELFFDGRYSETVLDDNPDFVHVAQAFDIPGVSISTKTEVAPALDRMLTCTGPYLL